MISKKEPRERLDSTTKYVLLNMIRNRVVPLIEKERNRLKKAQEAERKLHEQAISEWNKAAEPAKLAELLRRPKMFITTNSLGGPLIDNTKLDEWYSAKHPRPVPSPIETMEFVDVEFAALYDDKYPFNGAVIHVPASLAKPIRDLADAIDNAFLSGTAVGLIEAINSTAKSLGE